MTNTCLYLIFFMTIMFFFTKNLLSLGLILITQTLLLSMFFGTMMNNFWFLYLLILVFIGGILILFIYTTSILPNMKFFFNQNFMLYLLIFSSFFLFLLFTLNFFFNITFYMNFINSINMKNDFNMAQTLKIFSSQINIMLIFMVSYLFYCMIVVIKITNSFTGPLRKM